MLLGINGPFVNDECEIEGQDMPATHEAASRTRAFARVIGPYLIVAPSIVAVRAPDIGTIAAAFFGNEALVWIMGTMLLFGGLMIIANHQYWSSLAAVLISLFGWFLALRGVLLLAVPRVMESAASAAMNLMPVARFGFAALVLAGLWLTFTGWIARPVETS